MLMKVRIRLFLFLCASVFFSVQLYAQRHVTVLNPGFEKPDSGKIKGWDGKCADHSYTGKVFNIPGWNTDAKDSGDFDSGIEPETNFGGKYRGFMMGRDTSMYQICRRISEGDRFEFSVEAMNLWQADKLRLEMFYLLDDSIRTPIVTQDIDLTPTITRYSISFNSADYPNSIGWKLGILLDNVSTNPTSWVTMDNVELLNTDPTIIDVPNYSFELPDTGKIKGWDGVCSDPAYTGILYDIPGWSSDAPAFDSGVELNYTPTDGLYTAFLKADDSPAYNTTDYTITADDIITARVDSRITYAADMVEIALYYVGATGEQVPIDVEPFSLNTDNTYAEYLAAVSANQMPECIGKKLGISIRNSSSVVASWIGVDNVRLNANHAVVTGIGTVDKTPTLFSLSQNYPNPFNPTTLISYILKNNGKVRLSVYDVLGREVKVLVDGVQTAGSHSAMFSGEELGSGVYFYALQTAEGKLTNRMMLVK
jgi:hypothetical protein